MKKVLIIDDERLARVELKRLLAPYSRITVLGEASNAIEAAEKIKALQPDLIFLDIQMPGKNGFELLRELDQVPDVIFTTAYDDYALKAFEFNALDYLLKPVLPRRLDNALKKVFERNNSENETSQQQSTLNQQDQIFVKDGDRCWFVKLSEIKYFESEGNYVRIHFDNFKPLILKSLNSIEERLDPKTFFRGSRSNIINLKWIDSIESSVSGGLVAKLKSGERIEISRRQSLKFKEMLSL
ncbi:MAG: LytR/AlgR family response regulator transcription factor [Ignavibacteriales bacterium]